MISCPCQKKKSTIGKLMGQGVLNKTQKRTVKNKSNLRNV